MIYRVCVLKLYFHEIIGFYISKNFADDICDLYGSCGETKRERENSDCFSLSFVSKTVLYMILFLEVLYKN